MRRSRVVPATSETIACRRDRMRLNKEDLPTLGRPTIATTGAGLAVLVVSSLLASPWSGPGCTCWVMSFTTPILALTPGPSPRGGGEAVQEQTSVSALYRWAHT